MYNALRRECTCTLASPGNGAPVANRSELYVIRVRLGASAKVLSGNPSQCEAENAQLTVASGPLATIIDVHETPATHCDPRAHLAVL